MEVTFNYEIIHTDLCYSSVYHKKNDLYQDCEYSLLWAAPVFILCEQPHNARHIKSCMGELEKTENGVRGPERNHSRGLPTLGHNT